MQTALEAGFMISTQYGKAEPKLMPRTDIETLVKFAKLLLEEIKEK